MKSKTSRHHRRVHGGLSHPRSTRYGRARKKQFLVSGSRFMPMKAVKEPASPAVITGDVIVEFFQSLAAGHPQVPKPVSGTVRFELKDANRSEYWRVTFTKGLISSAVRSNGPADSVVHTDKATLEGIIQGRVNTMAALLRGAITVEGGTLLLALLRGLLTEPAAVPQARRLAKNMGRRS